MPNPNLLCCNLNSVLLTTAKGEWFYSMLLYLCLLTPFWITGLPSLWIKWIQVWSFFQGPVLFLFTWCCFLGSLQLTCISVAVIVPDWTQHSSWWISDHLWHCCFAFGVKSAVAPAFSPPQNWCSATCSLCCIYIGFFLPNVVPCTFCHWITLCLFSAFWVHQSVLNIVPP